MGIEVSKCPYYNGFCYETNQLCKDVDDKYCTYKQLQQLKAELQAYKDKVKPIDFVDSDEYLKVVVENKQLKAENEELRARNSRGTLAFLEEDFKKEQKIKKYKQCLDEIFENIEYIEATAERIDDDNYIALACRIAETSRNILQLIKQAKEGGK